MRQIENILAANFNNISLLSRDSYLAPVEIHYAMAETAFRQGDFKRAFFHYEKFYDLNNGSVSLPILEKLFIYSIELGDYPKSVQYFNSIFGDYLPDKLTEDRSGRMLEALSLFMDKGWYNFVSGIYEQLVTHNTDNNRLLYGWITTLVKNKEIEKAQSLINVKKKIKVKKRA